MERKKNKKALIEIVIAVFIFVILLALVISSVCLNDKNGNSLKIFVTSDIHVAASETIQTSEQYVYYGKSERLKDASEAVFRSFADEIIAQKAKYLFVAGDLTDNGEEKSARSVATTLSKLQKNGVKVFVINGNHDIDYAGNGAAINFNDFKNIFNEFGYKDAISTYAGTLSYMASINDKYNLIAIDNIEYYRPDGTFKKGFDTDHRFWVCEQVDECVSQGKIPIVMAHRPFMNHYPGKIEMHDYKTIKDEGDAVLSYFAKKGVEYVFVGHEHFNDIKEKTYVFENDDALVENTVCEVMISCLCMSKSYYREVVFGEKETKFAIREMTKINTSYLSEFASNEQRAEMSADYSQYISNRLRSWLDDFINSAFADGGLLDISMPKEELTELYEIAKTDIVKKLLVSPLYIKDEKAGEISMQRILMWYGKDMPATGFITISNFVFDILTKVVAGERKLAYDGFYDIVKYTVYELIWYFNESSTKINAWIAQHGGEKFINLDMDRLIKNGELECYESGFVPALIVIASDIIYEIIPSDNISLVSGILNSLSNDLSILRNGLISALIGGMFFQGYNEYIYEEYIDIDGLLIDGIMGIFLDNYTEEKKYNGKEIIITKEELKKEVAKDKE